MKTIVWDVDDVLNELMFCWFKDCYQKEHSNSSLTFDKLVGNPPHAILNISREEYLISLDQYRMSDKGRTLPPNRHVLTWFQKDGHKYRHIALTARPRRTLPLLAEWVFRHYGDWIRTLAFVPSARSGESLPVYDSSKADYLVWLEKVVLFIDDSEENIQTVQKAGIKSLLYPRPWNKSPLDVDQFFKQLAMLVESIN
jgi:phosphoglycolate phosphatase-like HAD superfamily hydrolase